MIGLKEGEGVDITPGVEEDQMTDKDLRPGLETSIWRRPKSDCRKSGRPAKDLRNILRVEPPLCRCGLTARYFLTCR